MGLLDDFLKGNHILKVMVIDDNVMNHILSYLYCIDPDNDDYIEMQVPLIARSRSFFMHNGVMLGDKSYRKQIESLKLKQALNILGHQANNIIINGKKELCGYDGLYRCTSKLNNVGYNYTVVNSTEEALRFFDDLENIIKNMYYKVTHIIVGSSGYNHLMKCVAYYPTAVGVRGNLANKPFDHIILLNRKISIVWAGKAEGLNLNAEIIPDYEMLDGTVMTDIYLVDFSEKGVVFSCEYIPTREIEFDNGIKYVLEMYQMMTIKSDYCAYRYCQAIKKG
jgi:hypothetical protein